MERDELKAALAVTAWIVLGSVLAAALFEFYFLAYLLLCLVVLFGLGVPWIFSGTEADRRFAIICVASTVMGGLFGLVRLLVLGALVATT